MDTAANVIVDLVRLKYIRVNVNFANRVYNLHVGLNLFNAFVLEIEFLESISWQQK